MLPTFYSPSRIFQESGCTLLSLTASTATCACVHTTNFALLMQLDEAKSEDNHIDWLIILTYVCVGVALACLVIALLALLYIR